PCNALRREQLTRLLPRWMAKLECVLGDRRQVGEEGLDQSFVELQIRRTLEKDGPQPITQEACPLEEDADFLIGIGQPLEVRNALRRLQRELKSLRNLRTPLGECLLRREPAERVIDFDRRELRRVVGEPALLFDL